MAGSLLKLLHKANPFGGYAEDGTEVFVLRLTGGEGRLHGAACSYDMSPDEDFIIDTLPDNNNIMVRQFKRPWV